MPHMIPDDIEQFTTGGEEAFYRFLSFVAKLVDRFVCWKDNNVAMVTVRAQGTPLQKRISMPRRV